MSARHSIVFTVSVPRSSSQSSNVSVKYQMAIFQIVGCSRNSVKGEVKSSQAQISSATSVEASSNGITTTRATVRSSHQPCARSTHPILTMLAGRVAARSFRVAAPRFQIAATRSFAEAAAKPADSSTKPPVELFGVDGTYASALVRIPLVEKSCVIDGISSNTAIGSTPQPLSRNPSTPSPKP